MQTLARKAVPRGREVTPPERPGYVRTVCPATRTVEIIGGRWKLSILWHLRDEVQRYSDLQRALPGITPKMLTQQLRELEDDGIVHREVYRQVPPKVEYSITPLGESLRPVIHAITEWGKQSTATESTATESTATESTATESTATESTATESTATE